MIIETTRKQRWTFTLVSDLVMIMLAILLVALGFRSLILAAPLIGVTIIHVINWKLIDWGIEYRELRK